MFSFEFQGSDIHVIVPTMFKKSFESSLTINNTYTIGNFQGQPNDMLFKTSNQKYLLRFTGGTTIGNDNNHVIFPKPIKFTTFKDIISRKWNKYMLIGLVVNSHILL